MTGLDEQKPSRRLWIFAAVTALALHVGGAALAIVHLQTEEADDALGASAIEVGLELASVRREVTDLPPGPDKFEDANNHAMDVVKGLVATRPAYNMGRCEVWSASTREDYEDRPRTWPRLRGGM